MSQATANYLPSIDMIDILNQTIITQDMRVVDFTLNNKGEREGLTVNFPTAIYDHGVVRNFEIASAEAMRFVIDELFKGFAILNNDLQVKMKEVIDSREKLWESDIDALTKANDKTIEIAETLADMLRKTQREFRQYKEETEAKIKENEQYREWYGDYINPTQIIEELYNGNRKGQFDILVPIEEWKAKPLKRNTAGVRFWLSFMEEHEIIQVSSKDTRVALVTKHEAKKIIKQKRV